MFGIVILGIWGASKHYKPELESSYPAPGRMVDVGGYKMHIQCMGHGSPTVVMDAGSNEFSVQWTSVQSKVAIYSRVCVYDRAGLGWSARGYNPRTSSFMVKELHQLLENADEPGPYVMVGHSFGGLNARLYTHEYPEQVQGLVLVDSAHEDQIERIPALEDVGKKMTLLFKVMQLAYKTGALAVSPESIPDRGLTGDALDQYRAVLATKNHFKAAEEESRALAASFEEIKAMNVTSLGNLPLVVVSRGMKAPLMGMEESDLAAYESSWKNMQSELVSLSSNGRQMKALHSGHYIHLSEPQVVIRAVREVLLQIRKNG